MANLEIDYEFEAIMRRVAGELEAQTENEPNLRKGLPSDPVVVQRTQHEVQKAFDDMIAAMVKWTILMTAAADHGNVRLQKKIL